MLAKESRSSRTTPLSSRAPGRFYYLDLVKGKPGYRRFIAPTARRLLRNFALTSRTTELLPLLREHFEAMQ